MDNLSQEFRAISSLVFFFALVSVLFLTSYKKYFAVTAFPWVLAGLAYGCFVSSKYLIFEILSTGVREIFLVLQTICLVKEVSGKGAVSFGKFQHQIILKSEVKFIFFRVKVATCSDVNRYVKIAVFIVLQSGLTLMLKIGYLVYAYYMMSVSDLLSSYLYLSVRVFDLVLTLIIASIYMNLDPSPQSLYFLLGSISSFLNTILEYSFFHLLYDRRISISSLASFIYSLSLCYYLY